MGPVQRTAVVTGAAAGIGQALAIRLGTLGMNVIAADLHDASETVARIDEVGGHGLFVQADVSEQAAVTSLATQARDRFGPVTIVVNNAGVYPLQRFEDITVEDWDRVLRINLRSLFLVTQTFVADMKQERWGRVVSMSSASFHSGTPGFAHYVTTKGGVVGFTRSVATELGSYGITVNAIAPSIVRTPGTLTGGAAHAEAMTMLAQLQAIGRTQTPEDLAGMLAYLVSDDAAFMTGQTVVVDGGLVRV